MWSLLPGAQVWWPRRYGCSKWATEVQLQQLHREFGVPVSVFRCGMILAHSKCAPPLCCPAPPDCAAYHILCVLKLAAMSQWVAPIFQDSQGYSVLP